MTRKGELLMVISLGSLLRDIELRLGFFRPLGFGEETQGIASRKNLGWFGRY